MRDFTPSPAPRLSAFISTTVLTNGVVFTQMGGYIDAALCERQREEFEAAVQQHPGVTWIIEAERVAGFDPRAVKAGASWFSVFKRAGGECVIYVSRIAAARMAAQALGFGASIKVVCVEGIEQARESIGLTRQSA